MLNAFITAGSTSYPAKTGQQGRRTMFGESISSQSGVWQSRLLCTNSELTNIVACITKLYANTKNFLVRFNYIFFPPPSCSDGNNLFQIPPYKPAPFLHGHQPGCPKLLAPQGEQYSGVPHCSSSETAQWWSSHYAASVHWLAYSLAWILSPSLFAQHLTY